MKKVSHVVTVSASQLALPRLEIAGAAAENKESKQIGRGQGPTQGYSRRLMAHSVQLVDLKLGWNEPVGHALQFACPSSEK